MAIVTATGEISPDQIGRSLIHEHLLVAFPGAEFDSRYDISHDEIVETAVSKLKDLRGFGVNTLIDPTPIELGRNAHLIREIAEKAEMNIICSTGFYFEAVGLPFYWRLQSAEQIAELYIRELTKGIGKTGIRPGVIKCGTGAPAISDLEWKFLEAVCIAHEATGAPIITHTQDGVCGPEQARFFRDRGISADKCLIGHSCGNADQAYHARIAEHGVFIGFDRVGYESLQPDAVRADCVAGLIRRGMIEQVMLSQDKPFVWVGRYPLGVVSDDQVAAFDQLRAQGRWPVHPRYLFTNFLPLLRERGISDAQIDQMLIGNVRAYLS